MVAFIEREAAKDFEAALGLDPRVAAMLLSPPPEPVLGPRVKPEDDARIERSLQRIILDRVFAGEPVLRDDFRRHGLTDPEIDRHFPAAAAAARTTLLSIRARGVRRARVPAGRHEPPVEDRPMARPSGNNSAAGRQCLPCTCQRAAFPAAGFLPDPGAGGLEG